MRGGREVPAWRCGRWALAGADVFSDEVPKAAMPDAEVLRIWFPDNNACPDACAFVRSEDKTRPVLVLVQVKLSVKFGIQHALHAVAEYVCHYPRFRVKRPRIRKAHEHRTAHPCSCCWPVS